MTLGQRSLAHAECPTSADTIFTQLHKAHGTLAFAAVIAGYIAIIAAYPHRFLTYDRDTQEWSEWRHVIHAALGHTCAFASFVQLQAGYLRLSGHRQLGKVVHTVGVLNILLATWFWDWSVFTKMLLCVLLAYCLFASGGHCSSEDTMERQPRHEILPDLVGAVE